MLHDCTSFSPFSHCIKTNDSECDRTITTDIKENAVPYVSSPLLPTPKPIAIYLYNTGLTVLDIKELKVYCFTVAPTYYLGHVDRICTIFIYITVPPTPVSFTTTVSMVTGKTVLLSLLLHCPFHPKQPSHLISNTTTLSESRCTTYIQE